jgi:hypothetical protein
MLGAGVCQFFHHIPLERSGIHHIEGICLAVEHSKAIMVLGGENEVFHTCILSQGNPLVRIEVNGIEALGKLGIFRIGDGHEALDPLCIVPDPTAPPFTGQQRVKTPMGHHTILGLFEPGSVIHKETSVFFSVYHGGAAVSTQEKAQLFFLQSPAALGILDAETYIGSILLWIRTILSSAAGGSAQTKNVNPPFYFAISL